MANNGKGVVGALIKLGVTILQAASAQDQRLNEGNPSIKKNIQDFKDIGNAGKNVYRETKKKLK